eukprot:6496971-Prorocentrum_lima.AAC.1
MLDSWPRLEGMEYLPQPTRRIPMFGHRWGRHSQTARCTQCGRKWQSNRALQPMDHCPGSVAWADRLK